MPSKRTIFPIFTCISLVLLLFLIITCSIFLSCSLSRAPIVFVRSSKDADVTWSVRSSPFHARPKAELHLIDIKSRSVSFEIPIESFAVGSSWWWWWPTEYRFRAQLKDLKARHAYHYEILEGYGDGGKKVIYGNELFWMGGDNVFHEDPVVLGVISDNQLGLKPFQTVLETLKTVHKDIHYLIHAGDAVQDYDSSQWETHFAGPLSYAYRGKEEEMSLSPESSQRDQCFLYASPPPIIYAHGNHDEDITDMYLQSSGPHDGVNYFAMTVGSARIVALDSWPPNMPMKNQLNWLQTESASTFWQKASFRIAIFHQPAFIEHWDPHGWEQDGQKYWNKQIRTILLPELIKRGVNLIINGHQHAYARGWLGGALLKALTDHDPTMFQNSSEARANARGMGHRFRTATRTRIHDWRVNDSLSSIPESSSSSRSSSSSSSRSSNSGNMRIDSGGNADTSSRADNVAIDASRNSSGSISGKKKKDNTSTSSLNFSQMNKRRFGHSSPGSRVSSPRGGVSMVHTTVKKTSRRLLLRDMSNSESTSENNNNNNEKKEPLPIPVYKTIPGHAMLVTVGGAGGDLDLHPVEDWGYVEITIPHTHHFAIISLHSGLVEKLRWRTYDTKQNVIDAFDLVKSSHK